MVTLLNTCTSEFVFLQKTLLILFITVVTGAIRAQSAAVGRDNFSIQFMMEVQASLCVLFLGCCGPRLKLII